MTPAALKGLQPDDHRGAIFGDYRSLYDYRKGAFTWVPLSEAPLLTIAPASKPPVYLRNSDKPDVTVHRELLHLVETEEATVSTPAEFQAKVRAKCLLWTTPLDTVVLERLMTTCAGRSRYKDSLAVKALQARAAFVKACSNHLDRTLLHAVQSWDPASFGDDKELQHLFRAEAGALAKTWDVNKVLKTLQPVFVSGSSPLHNGQALRASFAKGEGTLYFGDFQRKPLYVQAAPKTDPMTTHAPEPGPSTTEAPKTGHSIAFDNLKGYMEYYAEACLRLYEHLLAASGFNVAATALWAAEHGLMFKGHAWLLFRHEGLVLNKPALMGDKNIFVQLADELARDTEASSQSLYTTHIAEVKEAITIAAPNRTGVRQATAVFGVLMRNVWRVPRPMRQDTPTVRGGPGSVFTVSLAEHPAHALLTAQALVVKEPNERDDSPLLESQASQDRQAARETNFRSNLAKLHAFREEVIYVEKAVRQAEKALDRALHAQKVLKEEASKAGADAAQYKKVLYSGTTMHRVGADAVRRARRAKSLVVRQKAAQAVEAARANVARVRREVDRMAPKIERQAKQMAKAAAEADMNRYMMELFVTVNQEPDKQKVRDVSRLTLPSFFPLLGDQLQRILEEDPTASLFTKYGLLLAPIPSML